MAKEYLKDDMPQVQYGVFVAELTDGQPIVEMVGEPNAGQLERLLIHGILNLTSETIAMAVVDKLKKMGALKAPGKKKKIIQP